MLGHARREQVRAVHIDTPQLLHTVVRVVDGIVVLGEASGRHQDVDFAVRLHNTLDAVGHRSRRGDIAEVG